MAALEEYGFSSLLETEKDAFSELIKTYKHDHATYTDTVNLGIGVYLSEDGTMPMMAAARTAERRVVDRVSKAYPPMTGDPEFCAALKDFFCADPAQQPCVAVVQTVAGSGALHLISEVLAEISPPQATFWLPHPTWANFWPLTKTRMRQNTYGSMSPDQGAFSFDVFGQSLATAQAGDPVLLQLIGNNPTGIDPDLENLEMMARFLRDRSLFPVIDAAYVGFGEGPEEDAARISNFLQHFDEAALAFSGSKSFSLYSDRVGAALFVTRKPEDAERVETATTARIRQIYSMPPVHGARIVTEILQDPALRQTWCAEVKGYADRLQRIRTGLAAALTKMGSDALSQRLQGGTGMFFLTGLDNAAVLRIRDEERVYLAPDGRINLSGLKKEDIARIAGILHRMTPT